MAVSKKGLSLFLIFLAGLGISFGQETPENLEPAAAPLPLEEVQGMDLSSLRTLLGIGPQELVSLWGPATEVFPWNSHGLVFVALLFSDYQYGFFLNNRLWMIRFDHRHQGRIGNFLMGWSKEKISQALDIEPPSGDDWILPKVFPSHPVSLRLVFQEDQLYDAYLYRSDF